MTMSDPAYRAEVTEQLIAAATLAGRAPSIHNTQPWRWRIRDVVADLHVDTRRQLDVTDSYRHLLTLSCGAALHHATVSLAARGFAAEVNLLPSVGDPFHLARITVVGSAPTTEAEKQLYGSIPLRQTDRRPLRNEFVPGDLIADLQSAVRPFDTELHVLDRVEVVALARATAQAESEELADSATLRELRAWSGTDPQAGVGIPDTAIPNAFMRTRVASRDFGHVGSLPVDDRNDAAATYAILSGGSDRLESWLRAGQALSAMWLLATRRQVALLPLSAAIELPTARQLLRELLGHPGHSYLAVRLGITDVDQAPIPHTPRLPAGDTVKVVG
jgi:nitroreductase